MNIRRMLSRLALLCGLGLSLLVASGQERVAQATACPSGWPACSSNDVCVSYCTPIYGVMGHFCNTHTHCCVCAE